MHFKGLAHGTGSAEAAADYLTNDIDHTGTPRGGVEIHSGDPYQTAGIADSLEFTNRYWSSVIGFHPDNMPSPEVVGEIIDEFNKSMFAGIDESRISHSWIVHSDQNGHIDIHNLGAKVDLLTGKHFNPLPPGWQKQMDLVRDYFNAKYGWKSPDIEANPENARLVQPGKGAYKDVRAVIATGTEDPRQVIAQYVMYGIESGLIENRDDMIQYLKESGFEVPRISAEFITVKDPDIEKNGRWRLRGVLFDERFTPERAIEAQARKGSTGVREPDPAAAKRIYKRIEEARKVRAEYNQKRYQPRRDRDPGAAVKDVKSVAGRLDPASLDLDRGINGQLGNDEISNVIADQNKQSDSPGESGARRDPALAYAEPDQRPEVPRPAMRRSDRPGVQHPRREALHDNKAIKEHLAKSLFVDAKSVEFRNLRYVDTKQGIIFFTNNASLTVNKDRVTAHGMSNRDAAENIVSAALAQKWERIHFTGSDDFLKSATTLALKNGFEVVAKDDHQQKIIDKLRYEYEQEQRINAARTVVDEAVERAKSSIQRSVDSGSEIREEFGDTDKELERLVEGLQVMKQHNNDELSEFKNRINIVEYLASQGFQKDENESSRNSFIMRNGDEKLVVTTGESGHGIYFNVHDDNDHGTIIDFVKNHQEKNLGQVRKELRPWIGQREMIDVPRYEKPKHLNVDRKQPLKAYISAKPGQNDYLKKRGILAMQMDPRFSNIRSFNDGSVIFPHYDRNGFSGYERKGDDVTIFGKQGEKRAWATNNINNAERLVIAETAIDAMSHAELKPDDKAAYMSFAGAMSPEQKEYLVSVIQEANARGAVIVAATDNDAAGNEFAEFIQQHAKSYERDLPAQNDWNQDLTAHIEKEQQEEEVKLDHLRYER